ncbi:DUF5658 family protein [Fictibacillus nanhaiensis]|uniref:DUF5658 family protein n=1 Tax=Fictibacillus nanhaiensis TaxID=742169 RepID=UPI0020401DA9|nr:DUF5658 family protein [Fictibacillus nanhaiensis]MCM3731580.1 DUF5658 family protein [Fictibacillus nanhaiensis]
MKTPYQIQPHFWICMGLGILNMVDAIVTHFLLINGARELNPLMNALYAYHPAMFLILKFIFSIVVIWFGFIPVHKNVKRLSVPVLIIYFVVVAWQLFLFLSI